MTIQLVALRCPGCKTALNAATGKVLYLCPQCATAVEATRDALIAHPVVFAKGDGAARLWWRLEADVRIDKFSATKPAQTPYGTADQDRTLEAVFQIPADEASIGACYRGALDASKKIATTPGRATSSAATGRLSQRAAELVARHVFLTHVARADGQVHFLEFTIAVTATAVLVAPPPK